MGVVDLLLPSYQLAQTSWPWTQGEGRWREKGWGVGEEGSMEFGGILFSNAEIIFIILLTPDS